MNRASREHANSNPPRPFLKDVPADIAGHLTTALTSTGATLTQGMITWGFEVIKHLAVINAAGLAGATALYSAAPAKAAAAAAIPWFLGGLLIAIVTMVSIYIVGFVFAVRYQKEMMQVLANLKPLDAMKAPLAFWVATGVNWLLAASSIAAFVIGLLDLVRAM